MTPSPGPKATSSRSSGGYRRPAHRQAEPAPPAETPLDDAAKLALESNHYVVLGVNIDVTHKQLQQAMLLLRA